VQATQRGPHPRQKGLRILRCHQLGARPGLHWKGLQSPEAFFVEKGAKDKTALCFWLWLVENEIAQAVSDRASSVDLNRLHHVRMMTDDQVGASLQ
jgi:hypothetical protein